MLRPSTSLRYTGPDGRAPFEILPAWNEVAFHPKQAGQDGHATQSGHSCLRSRRIACST